MTDLRPLEDETAPAGAPTAEAGGDSDDGDGRDHSHEGGGGDEGSGGDEGGRGGNAGLIAAGLVLMLVIAIGFGALFWTIARPPAAEHLTYTIPAGTDLRITTLQQVDVIPAQINLRQGGSITLINEDIVPFQFGTLSVAAGQTVTKTFPDTGTFRNLCRLTPGQEVIITVY
ncbi:MAG: hypothetical protein R2749_21905 [Acidimicrobiales bacterium]